MKKTIILILLIGTIGCSKAPKGTAPTSSYTCTCVYKKNPVKDTVVHFNWSGITADSAKSACAYKDAGFKSYAGVKGASCSLE